MLPGLKERHPDEDLDTILLRAMFAGGQVDAMKKAVAEGTGGDVEAAGALTALIKAIYDSADSGQFHISAPELDINLTKKAK